MGERAREGTGSPFRKSRMLFRGIPLSVFGVAGVLAGIHMYPVWEAHLQTPEDWVFTGNTTVSPDMMQYRVWSRQTLEEGVVVSNTLTSEPNRPHLPVLLYMITGRVGQWTGTSAAWAYAYLGAVFVFGLVLVVFVFVRHFIGPSRQVWPVFLATLLGGGLSGYLKLFERHGVLDGVPGLREALIGPTELIPVFDDYRQHYMIKVLMDTHFSFIWLLAALCMLGFYVGLQARSDRVWMGLVGGLWALTTLVHVYTGVTLAVVALTVGVVLRLRGLLPPRAGLLVLTQLAAVLTVLAWIGTLVRASGLPVPGWTEPLILPSTVALAYPLQLGLLAWGAVRFWDRQDLDSTFLIGWILGCLLLTLGSPFYPYPSRGTVTLMIPLTITAGLVVFEGIPRVRMVHWVTALVMLGGAPLMLVSQLAFGPGFREDRPYKFLGPEHREVLASFDATSADVLLSRPEDALWLAPTFPGRNYAAHFFLTVDYDRKLTEVEAFYGQGDMDRVAFAVDRGITRVFVAAPDRDGRFGGLSGLTLLNETPVGALYAVGRGSSPQP